MQIPLRLQQKKHAPQSPPVGRPQVTDEQDRAASRKNTDSSSEWTLEEATCALLWLISKGRCWKNGAHRPGRRLLPTWLSRRLCKALTLCCGNPPHRVAPCCLLALELPASRTQKRV